MNAERVLKSFYEGAQDVIDDPLTDANHSVPDALQDARYDVSTALLNLSLKVLLRAFYGLREESSEKGCKASGNRTETSEHIMDDAAPVYRAQSVCKGLSDVPPVNSTDSCRKRLQEPPDA